MATNQFLCFCLLTFNTFPLPTTSRVLSESSDAIYWEQRNRLLTEDLDQMLGHDLILSPDEEEVNDLLMKFKGREVNNSFENVNFLPSKNFFEAKAYIDNSEVFRVIQQMPKGAALHLHDTALTSIDWVISELTYWDDLYMCNITDFLFFRFFLVPDEFCEWKLVSEERASYSSPAEFDAYLFSKLSLYTTDVENTYPDINSIWAAFEQTFIAMSGLVTYTKAWESYLARALLEFMNDNIVYMEFRGVLPLLYEKDGTNYTAEETVQVYANVIQNFTSQHSEDFLGTRFIYAPPRLVDVETVWEYVKLVTRLRDLYPTIVAGFDLVGQEDLGQPLSAFIEPILTLREKTPPIPVFFHAGETNWEGLSSDENLFDALLLNSTRIGHGYAIVKHPQLMQMARENDVPIEVCPISNQILMLVEDIRNHPAAPLAACSFPLVVSSDDPAIWNALPLSHDFYEAFMGIGGAKADLKFLKKLALNSIRYSSLDLSQKVSLQSMWQKKWDIFINNFMMKRHSEIEKSNVIPTVSAEENVI